MAMKRRRAGVVSAVAGEAAPVPVQMVFDSKWTEKESLQVAQALVNSAVGAQHAARTVSAYASDWRDFLGWCGRVGRQALPADSDTVALYVADLSTRWKPSTLERRVAAIGSYHEAAGFALITSGSVRNVISAVRRKSGARVKRMAAISPAELALVSAHLGGMGTNAGLRDRAVMLLGFGAALRRSEIVGFDLSDVLVKPDRLEVNISRSKTDQDARGRQLVIPPAKNPGLCAVAALRAWVALRGTDSGPLFWPVTNRDELEPGKRLGPHVVYDSLRRAARAVGLDAEKFGAHSLRAGAATAAADAGADVFEVMELTGHRSMDIAASYVRRGVSRYALRGVL